MEEKGISLERASTEIEVLWRWFRIQRK